MRKALSLILTAVLLICMYAMPAMAATYTAGTYTASAPGNNGPVEVSVTVSDSAITAVEVIAHNETAGLSDRPIADIPAAIVENQSLAIDAISGATYTSKAILDATADAVAQAGGDVAALLAVTVAKAPVTDVEVTYDVVILGGGGAGLSAALSAKEAGASVIILEKAGSLGGNSLLAGGAFNACDPERQANVDMSDSLLAELHHYLNLKPEDFDTFAGVLTTVQEQITTYLAGDTSKLFDSPELHMLHVYLGGKRTGLDGTEIKPDLALTEIFAKNALDALNWASSYGVEWRENISTVLGAMWPRTHGVASEKITITFEKAARAAGVDIMTDTRANEIILENGKVVGVKATTTAGANVLVHATKGVVLATGGYAANAPMVVQYNNYWEGLADTMPSTNAPTITGDGIVMAEAVGARLTGMGYAQLMPSSHPVDGSLFSGIWGSAETQVFVNKEGKRFVNEYSERDVLSKAALAQTDKLFFIICDNKIAKNANVAAMEAAGNVVSADTLEELATKLGIPADAFVAEIDRYNSFIDQQKDEDFGKAFFGQKIDEAPFVATPRSPSLHHTMGGVSIDTDTHVLNDSGEIISGLYAAGEVIGGLHAGNRLGGNAMTDFLVFGRIAGANAAAAK